MTTAGTPPVGHAAAVLVAHAGAASLLVLGGLVLLPVLLAMRATRPAAAARPWIGQGTLAMTGDFISAAGFLGLTGLVALSGADALLYTVGWLVAWPIAICLTAEPMRALGRRTFGEALALRFRETRIRLATAPALIVVVIFYLAAQLVGAGILAHLLFGIAYETAIVVVGSSIAACMLVGAVNAAQWVQMVKTGLLLFAVLALALMVVLHFSGNPLAVLAQAADRFGDGVLAPSRLTENPLEALSLGLANAFGPAGLPHVVGYFTGTRNRQVAHRTVFFASGLIATYYLAGLVVGFGAAAIAGRDAVTALDPSGNAAALAVVVALTGGRLGALSLAAIVAIVGGLTLSGASALAHDLWIAVLRHGSAGDTAGTPARLWVARLATLAVVACSILLALALRYQNVDFLISLVFAIGASAQLPALLLTIIWRGFTSTGAVASILVGTTASLAVIYGSPAVQVSVLHHTQAWFPFDHPTLFAMPLALAAGVLGSLVGRPEPGAAARFARIHRQLIEDRTARP
jgi:cation/acetate symporter